MSTLLLIACSGLEPSDTAEPTDTAPTASEIEVHVEGTIAGEAYVFDCGPDATALAYASFPVGAEWFASVSCRLDDGSEWVDVVATDAVVGREYLASDAPSFNAFRVVVGADQYDYMEPSAYALTFQAADVVAGVGVTLSGVFSGTWADAELTGTFAAHAPAD